MSPVNAVALFDLGAAAICAPAAQKEPLMFKLSSKLLVVGLVSATLMTLAFMVWVNLRAPLY